MTTRPLALAALLSLAAAPLEAQSLFNSAGLGTPVDALDGRARAMGNFGIGLPGASLMPTDPGATAFNDFRTGIMAGQPTWVEYSGGPLPSGDFQGNRFPLLGVAVPLFTGSMSVEIGSVLDQRFTSETPGTVNLGGQDVATVDFFDQEGALSNLSLGYAQRVGPRFAAGLRAGRYVGSLTRQFTREFDPVAGVEDYLERGKWSYTGYSVTGGLTADLTDGVRVAASVLIPTALDADADAASGTEGQDQSFDLPMQLRVGATARLAPGLIVQASGAFADWSGVGDDLVQPMDVGSANGFGVGLELSRARLLGRQAPLRFGFRRNSLPFALEGGSASERVFSGGFGLDLNRTNEVLLAGADFALERGLRTSGSVEERFWRLTISLVVAGS
jgi:hypothetical protein